ncbi:hypothetical protein [Dictyobacter kobayashii]|uniref:SCP domain-containing protein n=1 Tax=Dictyobacter kobayashii TaxID=2014872 RepID=A0A402AEW4_9CHLR|nr:hypothetical protein [Dictyobacter kobayashii]GCE17635.1 hypothetical protein KDK_14350 [Dictyobacter kobayashii]
MVLSSTARKLVLLLLAAMLVNLLFVASTLSASAHASPHDAVVSQTVPLKLDCVHLSVAARKYAMNHGFCTTNGTTPNNTVSGDCGTSSLSLQSLGRGNAAFNESANSSLGIIVHVDYTVSWQNQTRNTFNSFSGSPATFTASWSNRDTRFTNTGTVYAYVADLTVLLVWGGTCSGLQPWDRISVL